MRLGEVFFGGGRRVCKVDLERIVLAVGGELGECGCFRDGVLISVKYFEKIRKENS